MQPKLHVIFDMLGLAPQNSTQLFFNSRTPGFVVSIELVLMLSLSSAVEGLMSLPQIVVEPSLVMPSAMYCHNHKSNGNNRQTCKAIYQGILDQCRHDNLFTQRRNVRSCKYKRQACSLGEASNFLSNIVRTIISTPNRNAKKSRKHADSKLV